MIRGRRHGTLFWLEQVLRIFRLANEHLIDVKVESTSPKHSQVSQSCLVTIVKLSVSWRYDSPVRTCSTELVTTLSVKMGLLCIPCRVTTLVPRSIMTNTWCIPWGPLSGIVFEHSPCQDAWSRHSEHRQMANFDCAARRQYKPEHYIFPTLDIVPLCYHGQRQEKHAAAVT